MLDTSKELLKKMQIGSEIGFRKYWFLGKLWTKSTKKSIPSQTNFIANLHFLRFFLGIKQKIFFFQIYFHQGVPLWFLGTLKPNDEKSKEFAKKEKKLFWVQDQIVYHLPW